MQYKDKLLEKLHNDKLYQAAIKPLDDETKMQVELVVKDFIGNMSQVLEKFAEHAKDPETLKTLKENLAKQKR